MPHPLPPLPQQPHLSTLYLDWVRLNDPANEQAAAEFLDGLPRSPRKLAGALEWVGSRAARAGLPLDHLPWLWDTLGHRLAGDHARRAGAAYAAAREAEARHRLPVSEVHAVDNALLFARFGALPAKEVRLHWDRLAGLLPAEEAYREFLRFLEGWARGEANLPADLVTRLRAAAAHAGLGPDEVGRALGRILTAHVPGVCATDRLLDAAAKVFAGHPPEEDARAALVNLFPYATTDGGAWLRLLESLGLVDDLADGKVVPEGGYAAWLSAFPRRYSQVKDGRYMKIQPMAPELHALVPRIADRVRAEGVEVRLDAGRWRPVLDLGFADTCLAAGLPVAAPGPRVELRSRIDGTPEAVAADPRFARFLHPRRPSGGAPAPAPAPKADGFASVPGLSPETARKLDGIVDRITGGTPAAAEEAVTELERLFDHSAALALAGGFLHGEDLSVPLARALRFGVPAEYTWPAFEEAVAEFAAGDEAVVGMSSSWPVLTLYGRRRAIAVDHRGRRAECSYTVPEDTLRFTVHHIGDDFLVTWHDGGDGPRPYSGLWCSEPERVITGMRFDGDSTRSPVLGFGFGGPLGRHEGDRLVRPGSGEGVERTTDLLGDGTRMWHRLDTRSEGPPFEEVDPESGRPTGRYTRPAFLEGLPTEKLDRTWHRSSLAPLPEGLADSPLGAAGGLVGFRISRPGKDPGPILVEGVDGRRGSTRDTYGRAAWGVLRMPGGGDGLLVEYRHTGRGPRVLGCQEVEGSESWWRVRAFSVQGSHEPHGSQDLMLYPPPAFWHFLTPRDPAGSRALRGVDTDLARDLLGAACSGGSADREEAVRGVLARALPQITDPRIVEGPGGVLETVLWVAESRRRLEQVTLFLSSLEPGKVVEPPAGTSDDALRQALSGLIPPGIPLRGERPATLTAIAADGAHLRGDIGEATRRVSPPGPAHDWGFLLDRTDSALWRLATGRGGEEHRALTDLLSVWADQPFAEQGTRWRRGLAPGSALEPLRGRGRIVVTGSREAVRHVGRPTPAPSPAEPLRPQEPYPFVQPAGEPAPEGTTDEDTVSVDLDQAARIRRLLELLGERGPVRAGDRAVRAFADRTGALEPLAALVLNGRLGLPDSRPGGANARTNLAAEYDRVVRALGPDGLNRLLGAALPEDPADLWEPDGDVRAAERAAGVWAELLGVRPVLDAEAVALLDKELKLGAGWAETLTDPSGSDFCTEDLNRVIAEDRYSSPALFEVTADGLPGRKIYHYDPVTRYPYRVATSLVAWPSARLPVGHPCAAGVPELHRRLVGRLRAPGCLVPVGSYLSVEDVRPMLEATGYERLPYRLHGSREPERGIPEVYGGPLLVTVARGSSRGYLYVRTAGFFEPGVYEATEKALPSAVFRDPEDREELLLELRGLREVCTGSLGRLAARTANTPVPVGGYEADPRLSVPELVEEAAAALGTDADAAALYLQLLTLSRPTDQNVRKWNGWSAGLHKKVSARLLEMGAVEQGKRPRAGRTLFVPDGWVAPRSPDLPLEAAKLETHFAGLTDKKVLVSPTSAQLPLAPLHEMFEAAWRSRGPNG
ncbi:hypothetical protein SUDANB121_02702 [Nocardiopsis dassonvillei]|uniref:hypothetical protein n=1 Tax=Nocardiopsis dassonvillei TaxID=2014 RepID=UPI003F568E4E